MNEEEGTKAEVAKCEKCDTIATVGCESCLTIFCLFCADRHSLHRRFRHHKRCSVEEIRTRRENERRFVEDLREAKRDRDELDRLQRETELEDTRARIARDKAEKEAERRRRRVRHASEIVTLSLTGGRRYEGSVSKKLQDDLKIRLPHGFGRLFSRENKTIYEGQWFEGAPRGHGRWYFRTNNRKSCKKFTWEGQFRHWEPFGSGTKTMELLNHRTVREITIANKAKHNFDNPRDLVGCRVRIGPKYVGAFRTAIVTDYSGTKKLWRVHYDDRSTGENAWLNLIATNYEVMETERVGHVVSVLKSTQIVPASSARPRDHLFKPAEEYVTRRFSESHSIRACGHRDNSLRPARSSTKLTRERAEWLESMTKVPRCCPDEGLLLDDDKVDTRTFEVESNLRSFLQPIEGAPRSPLSGILSGLREGPRRLTTSDRVVPQEP